MNDIFNFRRFGRCLQADLTRGASRFGITLLCIGLFPVYIGLLDCIDILVQHVRGMEYGLPSDGRPMVIFVAVALILAAVLPQVLYGHITDRCAGADFILSPASSLEKCLSMIVVCLIVAPAVFLGLYFGSDALVNLIDPRYGVPALRTFIDTGHVGGMIGNYLILLAFFLLGAIFFRRRKIIYTLLCGAAYLFVLSMAFLIAIAATDPASNAISGNNFSWSGDANADLAITLFCVAEAAVLLVLTYLRIRKLKV